MNLREMVIAETAGWTATQRAALAARLARESARLTCDREYRNAHRLAVALDGNLHITPMLDVVADALEDALTTPNARTVISTPPQIGKSTTVTVWGAVRALVQNPDRRIVIASYSDSLAKTHARTARNIVRDYGSDARDPLTGAHLPDRLGLGLADDKSAAGNWKLAGRRGGLYAVGVGGSLTGQPADVLIIDDPLRSMEDADSRATKDALIEWWESVAQTRLAPGAPVILIQTRWAEDDLAGHVLKQDAARVEGERRWRFVNIPALAETGTPDALERQPGEWLETSRGHTATDWERIRDQVGPRTWSALYQGMPTPSDGGLFAAEWFTRWRTAHTPNAAVRIVSIDPAETGRGDEAGLIALTATGDGTVYVTDDWSARMTSDVWARQAVLLALQTGATEILFEAFTTGPTYERVIRQAWREVRASPPPGVQPPDQDDPPFRIHPWRAKGDKAARAAGSRQAASTGRLRMVGTHTDLETQAVRWQQGMSSPDRVDAMVNGFGRCVQLVGAESTIAVPGTPATAGGFTLAGRMPSGL